MHSPAQGGNFSTALNKTNQLHTFIFDNHFITIAFLLTSISVILIPVQFSECPARVLLGHRNDNKTNHGEAEMVSSDQTWLMLAGDSSPQIAHALSTELLCSVRKLQEKVIYIISSSCFMPSMRLT